MKPTQKLDPKPFKGVVKVREASGLLTKLNTDEGVSELNLASDKQTTRKKWRRIPGLVRHFRPRALLGSICAEGLLI